MSQFSNFLTSKNRFVELLSLLSFFLALVLGCEGKNDGRTPGDGEGSDQTTRKADSNGTDDDGDGDTDGDDEGDGGDTAKLYLKSDDIKTGDQLDKKFACSSKGGDNKSIQLNWGNTHKDADSFTIILDDETPPCGKELDACRHWQIYNIPARIDSIKTGIGDASKLDGQIRQGLNYDASTNYAGPCPSSEHTYHVTLYSLDTSASRVSNKEPHTRASFEDAYADNILESTTLTFTFK